MNTRIKKKKKQQWSDSVATELLQTAVDREEYVQTEVVEFRVE